MQICFVFSRISNISDLLILHQAFYNLFYNLWKNKLSSLFPNSSIGPKGYSRRPMLGNNSPLSLLWCSDIIKIKQPPASRVEELLKYSVLQLSILPTIVMNAILNTQDRKYGNPPTIMKAYYYYIILWQPLIFFNNLAISTSLSSHHNKIYFHKWVS